MWSQRWKSYECQTNGTSTSSLRVRIGWHVSALSRCTIAHTCSSLSHTQNTKRNSSAVSCSAAIFIDAVSTSAFCLFLLRKLRHKSWWSSFAVCLAVANIWDGESMGNRVKHKRHENYVNSGRKKIINIHLMILQDADARFGRMCAEPHWIELIDNNQKSYVIGLTGGRISSNEFRSLLLNYSNRMDFVLCARCVAPQHRARIRAENAVRQQHANVAPALWRSIDFPSGATIRHRNVAFLFSLSRRIFIFSFVFLFSFALRINRQAVCVCVCAFGGVELHVARIVRSLSIAELRMRARAPRTLINQIDRSMSMHTLTTYIYHNVLVVAMHFDSNETKRNGWKQQQQTNNFIFSIHRAVEFAILFTVLTTDGHRPTLCAIGRCATWFIRWLIEVCAWERIAWINYGNSLRFRFNCALSATINHHIRRKWPTEMVVIKLSAAANMRLLIQSSALLTVITSWFTSGNSQYFHTANGANPMHVNQIRSETSWSSVFFFSSFCCLTVMRQWALDLTTN